MEKINQRIRNAWDNKEDKLVFATIDCEGNPNIVWVTCVKIIDDERILVVNNRFKKTLENILSGSFGALLFIAPEREAYQIIGILSWGIEFSSYRYYFLRFFQVALFTQGIRH